MNLRALIVDDEILARQRIRQMLQGEADIEVLQECSNGLEAVEATKHAPCPPADAARLWR